jgi:hypothetical protein
LIPRAQQRCEGSTGGGRSVPSAPLIAVAAEQGRNDGRSPDEPAVARARLVAAGAGALGVSGFRWRRGDVKDGKDGRGEDEERGVDEMAAGADALACAKGEGDRGGVVDAGPPCCTTVVVVVVVVVVGGVQEALWVERLWVWVEFWVVQYAPGWNGDGDEKGNVGGRVPATYQAFARIVAPLIVVAKKRRQGQVMELLSDDEIGPLGMKKPL